MPTLFLHGHNQNSELDRGPVREVAHINVEETWMALAETDPQYLDMTAPIKPGMAKVSGELGFALKADGFSPADVYEVLSERKASTGPSRNWTADLTVTPAYKIKT